MSTTKKTAGLGLTLAEMKAKLLASGKVTEKGLDKARQELARDPEWQSFLANQPQRQA